MTQRKTRITPPSPHTERFLTTEDIAKLLGVGYRTAFRWKAMGILPKPVRLLGTLRWDPKIIELWRAQGCPDCRKGWMPEGGAR